MKSETKIAAEKQMIKNMGLGAFVSTLCNFIAAAIALHFYDPLTNTVPTIAVLVGALAGPFIMRISWGWPNTWFAMFLSVCVIFLHFVLLLFFPNNLYHTWFYLNIGSLIIGTVWWLFLHFSLAKSHPKEACHTCDYDGVLKRSPKWLNTDYTGTCYVCLGKRSITHLHPHYKAADILNKYEAAIVKTKLHQEQLAVRFEEMDKQKLQGPEALGEALYQQTIALEQKYYDQAALRDTQIEFFEQGLRKLHRMMYNSMLAENMLTKQKELANLFDDNANDLGSVMSLKAQLEMHTEVIDRINSLSIQIDMHSSTSIANDLAKEIEEMQASL